jgi:hypothetical protein
LVNVVLPVDVPPATRMLARDATPACKCLRLRGGHDPGRDVIVESEHSDGGFADGEGRCGDDGRQQTLEPLARLGQLGRDTRGARMNLRADMVRDQADDALAIGGRQSLPGIGQPFRETVDPDAPVGVQHHLDDGSVFEEAGDGWSQRGAQHPRAARESPSVL